MSMCDGSELKPRRSPSCSIPLLGDALMHMHKLEEAETVSRQAVEMQRSLVGNNDPDLVSALNTLGVVLQRARKLDEAEALFREALAIKTRLLGPEHPE